jgi:hypothetical protein
VYLTALEATRFTSKYKQTIDDCLIWQGPLDRDGYGTFYFRRMNRRAHRVAWFSVHGDLPEDHVIHHICKNRSCVNPAHLEALIKAAHDSFNPVIHANSQKTHCPRGHAYDRVYGGQRYCSICEAIKRRRLRAKWTAEDTLNI